MSVSERITWTQDSETHWTGRHPGLRHLLEIEYDAKFVTSAPYFLYGADAKVSYRSLTAAKIAAAHLVRTGAAQSVRF